MKSELSDFADVFFGERSKSANAVASQSPVVFLAFFQNATQGAVALSAHAHFHHYIRDICGPDASGPEPAQHGIIIRRDLVGGVVISQTLEHGPTYIESRVRGHPSMPQQFAIVGTRFPLPNNVVCVIRRHILQISVDAISFRILKSVSNLCHNIGVRKDIVRMHKSHNIAGCTSHTTVEGVVDAAVRFTYQYGSRIFARFDNFERVVGGATVLDDVINVPVSLLLNGLNCVRNCRFAIVNGRYDGNFHLVGVASKYQRLMGRNARLTDTSHGYISRRVWGQPIDRALSPDTVKWLVREGAGRAGLDPCDAREFSGHSMRVGVAQDLLRRGFDTAAIMRAGGWSSINVLSRYLAHAEHNVWE